MRGREEGKEKAYLYVGSQGKLREFDPITDGNDALKTVLQYMVANNIAAIEGRDESNPGLGVKELLNGKVDTEVANTIFKTYQLVLKSGQLPGFVPIVANPKNEKESIAPVISYNGKESITLEKLLLSKKLRDKFIRPEETGQALAQFILSLIKGDNQLFRLGNIAHFDFQGGNALVNPPMDNDVQGIFSAVLIDYDLSRIVDAEKKIVKFKEKGQDIDVDIRSVNPYLALDPHFHYKIDASSVIFMRKTLILSLAANMLGFEKNDVLKNPEATNKDDAYDYNVWLKTLLSTGGTEVSSEKLQTLIESYLGNLDQLINKVKSDEPVRAAQVREFIDSMNEYLLNVPEPLKRSGYNDSSDDDFFYRNNRQDNQQALMDAKTYYKNTMAKEDAKLIDACNKLQDKRFISKTYRDNYVADLKNYDSVLHKESSVSSANMGTELQKEAVVIKAEQSKLEAKKAREPFETEGNIKAYIEKLRGDLSYSIDGPSVLTKMKKALGRETTVDRLLSQIDKYTKDSKSLDEATAGAHKVLNEFATEYWEKNLSNKKMVMVPEGKKLYDLIIHLENNHGEPFWLNAAMNNLVPGKDRETFKKTNSHPEFDEKKSKNLFGLFFRKKQMALPEMEEKNESKDRQYKNNNQQH